MSPKMASENVVVPAAGIVWRMTNSSPAAIFAAISSLLSTRAAVSFLVFTLLYTPCVAAIATIRRELDSRLKTVGVVLLQCTVAWVVAFVAYAIAGLV